MIHVAAKLALGPLLYAQAGRLKRTTIELPEPSGARAGTVGSGRALRVLVAGDSSAAGVGARTQDEALAAPLAQRLAETLARRVSWQLVARSGLTSEAILDLLRAAAPAPADVAVVVCGVNDITNEVPLAVALRRREHIASWLAAHCGVRHVVFPALPEMELFPAIPQPLAWYAGCMSRRNNRAQARWARRAEGVSHAAMDGVTESHLFCVDGFHPAPALYARVAARLTGHLAHVLPTEPERAR
jgi:lysophospholipase L1-like esterase